MDDQKQLEEEEQELDEICTRVGIGMTGIEDEQILRAALGLRDKEPRRLCNAES